MSHPTKYEANSASSLGRDGGHTDRLTDRQTDRGLTATNDID